MRYRSLKRKIIWVLSSLLLVTAAISFGVLYYYHLQELHLHDEHFAITAIKQVGPERGRLKTAYLAGLLDLALDKKVSLIGYQTDLAEKQLLSSPVIRMAKVAKIKPNILCVEYALRKPMFRLMHHENSAIDEEGVVIPLVPFFNEEELPELAVEDKELSVMPLSWGDKLHSHILSFIFDLVKIMSETKGVEGLSLKRLDLENLSASTLGKRTIGVTFLENNGSQEWNIILDRKEISLQLAHFVLLREYFLKNSLQEYPISIDLRVPSLAFVRLYKTAQKNNK